MRDFIDKHAPDLLLLQETHLRPEHSFSIPNYICYRNDRPNSAHGWGGTAILIKRNISHFHVPTPPLRTGVEATLVALTPNDQEPFMVASIYIPPNPNYRNLSADLDTLFKIFNTAIVAGDYNAKHTSWGCSSSDPRGNYLLRYITNNNLDLIAPPTPTRYGYRSASTIDYALIKNLNWPCTADSLAELSSDHNPIRFYFPRTPKFVIPPPQLNTTWSIFTKILTNPENFDLPVANSTQEIDDQVSNLTTEILNAHASASRPFYQTERPYVQGELKGLIKERNKARKTWQQTRHPQHKTELNRLQNIIKRKIYHYRQQAWEDNLLTLNAEDNSPYFPKSWKTAVVVPILKPGKNSALAKSYRPISLLPVLSKLAEKIILARLNDYLEREKILIPEQHGFRPRLSTSHQLLRVVEFIKEGNYNDECTAAVFLDIQKAFDRGPTGLGAPNKSVNDQQPRKYNSNNWLDQSAASYMLAGYNPQSFHIYFSDMGWRLASRAICPELSP
ncbi:probable RNA-directed DNA polymerase from transposon X-element [Trichonephila clavipes]|nr:probable RNA-directed DNA polymerase from transposon X-element [Trichonephila clavipes]